MAGMDPDGGDLLHCTNAARIDFPERVRTPGEARGAWFRWCSKRAPAAGALDVGNKNLPALSNHVARYSPLTAYARDR